MSREEILSQLKSQSTWRLFFLSFITLGIYTAHYIKRQTTRMNQYLDRERQISEGFVSTILILAYVTVILVIPYVLIEEGPIEGISNLLDAVWSILVLVWAFKARNRMNMLLSATKDQARWFHGLWTFLFTALYFNFKINTLNESLAEKGATAAG
jgi:hypothetical protein